MKRRNTEHVEGCPPFRVYDNGGKSLDRYTVVLDIEGENPRGFVAMLGLSEGGQAFSQYTEGAEGPHLGKRVRLTELTVETRTHIAKRLK